MLQVSSNMLKVFVVVVVVVLTVATIPPVLSRTSQLKKFQISAARKQKQKTSSPMKMNGQATVDRVMYLFPSPPGDIGFRVRNIALEDGFLSFHCLHIFQFLHELPFRLWTQKMSCVFHPKVSWVGGGGGWGWGCMEGRHTQWTPRLCKSISTLLKFPQILCRYHFSMVGSSACAHL